LATELPLLRRGPDARIVNVSSEVGSIGSMTFMIMERGSAARGL